jgi:cytochrome P450
MSTTVFDPFGDAFLADPYPQFARFVDAEPVFWSPSLGYWVVSRYDDCRRVMRDYAPSSAFAARPPSTSSGTPQTAAERRDYSTPSVRQAASTAAGRSVEVDT